MLRWEATTNDTSVYSWSASFYPQPLLNWKRKSTAGLTVDFPALNVVGFVSYSISTACFLYSPTIREQYAQRHPRAPEPTVRFNDFAFAAHAMLMVAMTYSQFYAVIWKFEVPKEQRTSSIVRGIILGCIFAVLMASVRAAVLGLDHDSHLETWTWIDVVGIPCWKGISCADSYRRSMFSDTSSSLRPSANTCRKPGSTTSARAPKGGQSIRFCSIVLGGYYPWVNC